jgi:hypothetical protein
MNTLPAQVGVTARGLQAAKAGVEKPHGEQVICMKTPPRDEFKAVGSAQVASPLNFYA